MRVSFGGGGVKLLGGRRRQVLVVDCNPAPGSLLLQIAQNERRFCLASLLSQVRSTIIREIKCNYGQDKYRVGILKAHLLETFIRESKVEVFC